MKDTQFKTLQGWFQKLNRRMDKIETSMATKGDVERLHDLVEQTRRRMDRQLSDSDQDKRIFRLAFERLEQKVESLQAPL